MIMVSVVMITYGHEKYIEEAINGVLNQKCNFDFELILSNDASPDNTHSIIQKILLTHPKANLVKYTLHEKNIGMMPNSLYALNLAKGKYIAFCEGDDYWTDNNKLQKQVEFMENHEDYVMSFHCVDVKLIDSNDNFFYPKPPRETLYLQDIIREHYIPTCSLIYRREIFQNGYPKWFKNSISGDIPLEILLSSKGKTKYFDIPMACYRRNLGGISQSREQISKMRKGYIYMYSRILNEIGLVKGYHLLYKLARLIAGCIRNFILIKFKLTN
jgi:glycosyltransferase involved in cell wall biosynthesis